MKKNIMLKSLSLLAVTACSATSGLLISKYLPQDNENKLINLSSYDGKLNDKFLETPMSETLLTSFANKNNLEHIDDLKVVNVNPVSKSFDVTVNDYSEYYNNFSLAHMT
jgi:hypothetical protein